MTEPDFPELKVSQILDKTTLVLTGRGTDQLRVETELVVLAEAGVIPQTDIPLFVPKATLEVTLSAGDYVVAKAPQYESVETFPAFPSLPTERTVRRRGILNVDESKVTGNPAAAPIRVGDLVIRPGDLGKFVRSRKAVGKTTHADG